MATIDDVATQLAAHERIMQDRYEHLEKGIGEIKSAESAEGEKMSTVNVENPMGGLGGVLPLLMGGGNWGGGSTAGAVGGGLGAGVLGGVLGGALLGNRRGGLLGGDGGEGSVGITPAQFQAGLNSVTTANDTTALMQGIADIKASVPLAEGQVQLALQGAQAQLTSAIDSTGDQIVSQITAAQLANASNFAAASRQASDILAASVANQNSIRSDLNIGVASINAGIANLATAGLQQTYALNTAIRDAADRNAAVTIAQGEATRALIIAGRDADMQRQISDLKNELTEQRADQRSENRARASETTIINTNTATAVAQQQQQQQQQLVIGFNNLVNMLAGLQNAVATNSNLIVGNAGAVTTGANTANPVNVRA